VLASLFAEIVEVAPSPPTSSSKFDTLEIASGSGMVVIMESSFSTSSAELDTFEVASIFGEIVKVES